MGLYLKEISLTNFRNYQSYKLSNYGSLTILIGPNAIGKTNIIEAIQLLSTQSSFRHSLTSQLILEGESFSRVSGEIVDDKRNLDFELQIENDRKKFFVNKKPKKTSELKGIFPSVTFTPNDLLFTKGSSSIRRNTLDLLGSQLNSRYYTVLKDYKKVLQHKNYLLKEDTPLDLIDSINELIITCGSQLTFFRFNLFKRISLIISDYYREISQNREILSLEYIPSWQRFNKESKSIEGLSREDIKNCIKNELSLFRSKEICNKKSLIGPHSDQINIFLNKKNASDFGSQGQQRSIVLAYKLAETEIIKTYLNQAPILLLDDVMSELDEPRRNSLMEFIKGDIQTIITTTNSSYFNKEVLNNAQIVNLSIKEN